MHELGSAGWAVQRKTVVQLCGMTRPANGVEDIAAGKAALAALKQVVSHEGIIIDVEQAAINERRARESKRQKQIGEQQQEMQRLYGRFARLSAQQPSTITERQTRGYELESLLADLFRANDLDYTGPAPGDRGDELRRHAHNSLNLDPTHQGWWLVNFHDYWDLRDKIPRSS